MQSQNDAVSISQQTEQIAPVSSSEFESLTETPRFNEITTETPVSAPETTTTVTTQTSTSEAPVDSVIDSAASSLQAANAQTAVFASSLIEKARESAHDIVENLVNAQIYMEDLVGASKELAVDAKEFTVVKTAESKDYLVQKARSSRDFTLLKAEESKDFIVEKSAESKQFLADKAEKSKDFAFYEAEQSKRFLSSQWTAFYNGSRWVYAKSYNSAQAAARKAQEGSQWLLSFVTPLTRSAAERSREGLDYLSSKAQEAQETLADMPVEASDAMASLSGVPLSADSTLGTSELENITSFYSTLSSAPALKVAPVIGTTEETVALIHQE